MNWLKLSLQIDILFWGIFFLKTSTYHAKDMDKSEKIQNNISLIIIVTYALQHILYYVDLANCTYNIKIYCSDFQSINYKLLPIGY